jgi:hypothetical protein
MEKNNTFLKQFYKKWISKNNPERQSQPKEDDIETPVETSLEGEGHETQSQTQKTPSEPPKQSKQDRESTSEQTGQINNSLTSRSESVETKNTPPVMFSSEKNIIFEDDNFRLYVEKGTFTIQP